MREVYRPTIYDGLDDKTKAVAMLYIAAAYIKELDADVELTASNMSWRKVLDVINKQIAPHVIDESFENANDFAHRIGSPDPTVCLLACLEGSDADRF